ncbi:MAG: hypothetical protein MZW92_17955 [Comamonadaceae bacterium]|nr:hypothetical protein [Comamonadaceae bacterium]
MAHITIIVGTESGNAQMCADYLQDQLPQFGHRVDVVSDEGGRTWTWRGGTWCCYAPRPTATVNCPTTWRPSRAGCRRQDPICRTCATA